MRGLLSIIAICFLSFTVITPASAQGEAAVPFLLITSSPEANGMAGINASRISNDALAVLSNPAQIGFQGFTTFVNSGFYLGAADWLPAFQQSDLTHSAYAHNLSLNLQKITSFPIPVSIAAGYSLASLNLGTFTVTGPGGPEPIGTFEAEEHSSNLSFAIAMDYFVKLGIGYTYKDITSTLAPFSVQGFGRTGIASVRSFDAGILLQVPFVDLTSKIIGSDVRIARDFAPLFDVSFGYVRSNLGDKSVVYIDPAQADPLPRTATMGLTTRIGFVNHGSRNPWEIASFMLSREAQDLLVVRTPAVYDGVGNLITESSWYYTKGSGSIRFYNNLIAGEWGGRVDLRKGWQLSIGEIFSYREGSMIGRGSLDYSTSGYSLRLSGFMKFFERIAPGTGEEPGFRFVADHLDVQFSHSSYEAAAPGSPLSSTTFNGLNVSIR